MKMKTCHPRNISCPWRTSHSGRASRPPTKEECILGDLREMLSPTFPFKSLPNQQRCPQSATHACMPTVLCPPTVSVSVTQKRQARPVLVASKGVTWKKKPVHGKIRPLTSLMKHLPLWPPLETVAAHLYLTNKDS